MTRTPENLPQEAEKSTAASQNPFDDNERDEREPAVDDTIALPAHVVGSGTLDSLVEDARDYAKASTAENTNKA